MKHLTIAMFAFLVADASAQQISKPTNDNELSPPSSSERGPSSPSKLMITPPNWSSWRGTYSGMSVEIGTPPAKLIPGGGDYGVVSAITGAIDVPASADPNMINKNISGFIVTSGILGLAKSSSKAAPAVAVYGGAHMGATNAQAWGANFTSKNYDTSGVSPKNGYNGQVYGVEVDVNLVPPSAGWSGSNVDGMWITGVWDSKVDGQMNAMHVGAHGPSGWKNAIKTDHGAAAEFAEIGKTAKSGASPSQIIHLISSDGKGDYHALIQADPDGSVSIKPNYYGQTKGLLVSSADPMHVIKIHPVEGIAAPSVATRALLVDLDGKGAKLVSVGPPDSCGKGRRCLSVPN